MIVTVYVGLQCVRVFTDMSSFSDFRFCPDVRGGGGDFLIFQKISGFLVFVDSLWRTRVLLRFEPTWNARNTGRLLRDATNSVEVTSCVTASMSKSEYIELAAEGVFA